MQQANLRLAIADRGEAAMRLINSVREWNWEHETRLSTLAFYTPDEARAMYVREADEAYPLGPEGWDDLEALAQTLKSAGANAVWPGWSPAADSPAFAAACERLGITFVGPSAAVLTWLSDPQEAARIMEQVGLRVSTDPIETTQRSLEVHVIADTHGHVWPLGVLDSSARRGGRTLLEESPSPALAATTARALQDKAVALCLALGYSGAGALIFRLNEGEDEPVCVRFSPRLQAEHAVVDATAGLDLIKLQLQVAQGESLKGAPSVPGGHAIEALLCAEPTPDGGQRTLRRFRAPSGPGLRIERGLREGDVFQPDRDPLIARVTASGRTRAEALARLGRALSECVIVLDQGGVNKPYLLALLEQPAFRNGTYTPALAEGLVVGAPLKALPLAQVAIIQAALAQYQSAFEQERIEFFRSAARMRPEVRTGAGRTLELSYLGTTYKLMVAQLSPDHYRILIDGKRLSARQENLGRFESWLYIGEQRFRVLSSQQGRQHRIEVEGIPHLIGQDEAVAVRAPSPAVIVSVHVKVGDAVRAGDTLVVLESMKMELPIKAPCAGTVKGVLVQTNTQIGTGMEMFYIEPPSSQPQAQQEARLQFATLAEAFQAEAASGDHTFASLQQILQGFDADAKDVKSLVERYDALCTSGSCSPMERLTHENRLLELFGDICGLFRHWTDPDDPDEEGALSSAEYLLSWLKNLDAPLSNFPAFFVRSLERALAHYGVTSLRRSRALEDALLWIYRSHQNVELQVAAIQRILERRLMDQTKLGGFLPEDQILRFHATLDRIVEVASGWQPILGDLAREIHYRYFEVAVFQSHRNQHYALLDEHLTYLLQHPTAADRAERMAALVACPQPLKALFTRRCRDASPLGRQIMLEVLLRRHYRIRALHDVQVRMAGGFSQVSGQYELDGQQHMVLLTCCAYEQIPAVLQSLRALQDGLLPDIQLAVDVHAWQDGPSADPATLSSQLKTLLSELPITRPLRRATFGLASGSNPNEQHQFTFRWSNGGVEEDTLYRGLHPFMGKRLQIWRLREFKLERLPSAEDIYLFRGVARSNPKDDRLFALAEVRDLTPVRDSSDKLVRVPQLERTVLEAFAAIRTFQSKRKVEERLQWSRAMLDVWPTFDLSMEEFKEIADRLAGSASGLGLDKVTLKVQMPDPRTGTTTDTMLHLSSPGEAGVMIRATQPSDQPIQPLSEYALKVSKLRQRGLNYPYEVVQMLTPSPDARTDIPTGTFVEYDLDAEGALVPVSRPYGRNTANVVVGVFSNQGPGHPEGMTRVALLGDPSREMGSLSEPECRRIMAALDLARKLKVPLEWFALSAGAKISMESGTENMDWISRVLRDIILFTQEGGEINVVVVGINVGAQPYWNAEATMLLHTKGILIMSPESSMVLTGKTALDYSGSISAEDNKGIGGYERVMGPNGQAQYFARDLHEAIRILLHHYTLTYRVPGERFPRRAETSDPADRDVCSFPHSSEGEFRRVGEIFSNATNPGRKKPFEIRRVMRAVSDQDHQPLERWQNMADADTVVVWDANIGGIPVCMLGIESHQIPRLGMVPNDGPDVWTSGTLFPMSSKKAARAINAASDNRPLVILANLSGFDGSPESLRKMQLEYGAEIGRAVVNFRGPIVFVVISRYHGGAFVVFSKTLNDNMETVALEGTYASVIGGAPAAAVVFAREVETRTKKDPRLAELEKALASAPEAERWKLRARMAEVAREVRSQKLGEVAEEFDHIHSVHRALAVGSLDRIIPPQTLRPYLIDALERGMARELQRHGG